MRFLLSALLLLSQAASASIIYDETSLPKLVQGEINKTVSQKCPVLYGTETLSVTKHFYRYLGNEKFEYHVKISGRGYGAGDPDYDMELVVLHDQYDETVLLDNFQLLLPCR